MSQLTPFATGTTMAKPIPTQEHQALLDAVAQYPQGAGIDQIEAKLTTPPARRTVQRWLNELIAQNKLRKEGNGRATRYFPDQSRDAAARSDTPIPLSTEATAVLAHVRQPVQKRIPVGYNRAFLDSYRPNVSSYLSDATQTKLLAHGQAVTSTEPAGTYARHIAHRLLIDLAWNSSRLEGNTYSLLETERLLSTGETAQGKNALEAQMILNHKEAIEFLIASAQDIGFNRYTVLNLHALLSDNLLQDPTASGRLRTIPVGIGQTVFIPLEGPQRIDECFQQVLDTAAAIENPFEQAFFSMVHLPYLQPFEDVNKRVSRLAANIPLIQRNLCPLSFVDVPQPIYISAVLGIYELNRVELLRDVFVWAYQRSCARYSAVRQSLGEPDLFRTQYRLLIAETIADVVRQVMNKAKAVAFIRHCANAKLPTQDRERFVEVVETQLLSLHLGSIARYRLRPSEFDAWQALWQ
jgi:fido (protein-threonine AMPylation protein)